MTDHLGDFFAGCHEIVPGKLWQTSALGEYRALMAGPGPWAVISLISLSELSLENHEPLLEWPIVDGDLPDMAVASIVADFGAAWIENHGQLIVHCLEGNNRSGMICGLVMHRLGMGSGSEILAKIKAANPDALYNALFANYIASLPESAPAPTK